eukprot:1190438-Rhodomonas_salina.1
MIRQVCGVLTCWVACRRPQKDPMSCWEQLFTASAMNAARGKNLSVADAVCSATLGRERRWHLVGSNAEASQAMAAEESKHREVAGLDVRRNLWEALGAQALDLGLAREAGARVLEDGEESVGVVECAPGQVCQKWLRLSVMSVVVQDKQGQEHTVERWVVHEAGDGSVYVDSAPTHYVETVAQKEHS